MNTIGCENCQNTMNLKSKLLNEEFWICSTEGCHEWLHRSTVISKSESRQTSALPWTKIGEAIVLAVNKCELILLNKLNNGLQ
ncbi:MAG: hypothetical protein RL637_1555 [Pseudomonadota bacterium]|jgi:hypothetical protein